MPAEEGWHRVPTSLHEGVRQLPPLYLWYQTGKQGGQMSPEERANVITELDVLFGDDDPWYGFEKIDPPLQESKNIIQRESVWLTYRRGVHRT